MHADNSLPSASKIQVFTVAGDPSFTPNSELEAGTLSTTSKHSVHSIIPSVVVITDMLTDPVPGKSVTVTGNPLTSKSAPPKEDAQCSKGWVIQ